MRLIFGISISSEPIPAPTLLIAESPKGLKKFNHSLVGPAAGHATCQAFTVTCRSWTKQTYKGLLILICKPQEAQSHWFPLHVRWTTALEVLKHTGLSTLQFVAKKQHAAQYAEQHAALWSFLPSRGCSHVPKVTNKDGLDWPRLVWQKTWPCIRKSWRGPYSGARHAETRGLWLVVFTQTRPVAAHTCTGGEIPRNWLSR